MNTRDGLRDDTNNDASNIRRFEKDAPSPPPPAMYPSKCRALLIWKADE